MDNVYLQIGKRCFDILGASVLFILALPVIAVAICWIKAIDRGPAFFSPQRVGLHEKPFRMFKLRTMKPGSAAHHFGSVTVRNDPRLILGAWLLRKFKIDELPQLINVFNGTMSLVGPRPTGIDDYDRMNPRQRSRANIKPGITGLAQIRGGAALLWPERIELDLRYIEHCSFWLDATLLLQSVLPVLSGSADTNPIVASEWEAPEAVASPSTATDHSSVLETLQEAKTKMKAADATNRIYLSPPHMSPRDRELLLDAFDSNWIAPLGPHVDQFESEFAAKIGTAEAVALSSGTAALHLSLLMLEVKPGDEVLTSTLTFAATANAITYVGAQPVFIDSDRESWNMDPELLRKEMEASAKRGMLPKAVIAVDLYGQCADYDRIVEICQHYDVPLIEDAAEALGATYHGKSAGAFGTLGIFSFNGNKIITASGGGMLVTDRKDWADKARFLATQARDPAPHYQHSEIGYNYRMSNLLAAVGRGQLSMLDTRVDLRRANFEYYRQALADLPGIRFMPEISGGRSTRWLTCITIDPDKFGATAKDIRLAHERRNIESRPVWKPLHLQPVFSDCRIRGGTIAEQLFNQGLCLPSGSSLSDADRKRVVEAIRSACPKRSSVMVVGETPSDQPVGS